MSDKDVLPRLLEDRINLKLMKKYETDRAYLEVGYSAGDRVGRKVRGRRGQECKRQVMASAEDGKFDGMRRLRLKKGEIKWHGEL